MESRRTLEALYEPRIWFRVHVSTCGKQVPKDRDCQEPTGELERQVRKGDIATHLVQIVDKPAQVILLKVFHASYVFLLVKCVVEAIGKFGRRSVEG